METVKQGRKARSGPRSPGKWELVRQSFSDQRVWKRPGLDVYYLADHSGDGHRYHPGFVGNPDATHDGPLRLIQSCPIMELEEGGGCVAVIAECDDREYSVLVTEALMYWLRNELKMRIWNPRDRT